jgi:sugar O-acyltransferase (sialic acid O-acetyltransferase NeuD family)
VKLALVGYGTLGRQIEGLITDEVPASTTVYFDDDFHRTGAAGAVPFAAHTSDDYQQFTFYVCLGYQHLHLKQRLLQKLVELGRAVPPFVHPSSYVHRSVTIGAGSIIYAGCTVDRNTKLGRGVLFNNGTVVAHDGDVGDACWFSPGVTLSGGVTVGDRTFIGTGATVANNLAIGADVVVGLSTAVTKPIGSGASVIGNPMRVLDRKLRLT